MSESPAVPEAKASQLDVESLGSERRSVPERLTAPSRVAEELPTTRVGAPRNARGRRRTRRDLGPKWHKEYSQIDQHAGRVLIIDFVKQGTV
ncbi:hypothetical protein PRK78_003038 [Emydomyces testavorans]|uniref:Uncharacterized protein n=1 Tax=Emydomyces testavorans TaxID=2070801 RepID=A0AAF0DFC2_9EURO|nr:hypothetical protein PRK78_003038 [Emydomyces testavorans]